jgi:subtilisin family serine protease
MRVCSAGSMLAREGHAIAWARGTPVMVVLVLALLVALGTPAPAARGELLASTGQQAAPPYVPGRVLVRFESGASATQKLSVRTLVGALSRTELGLPGLERLALQPWLPAPQAVALLEHAPGVLYAEPDYTRVAAAVPNDPFLSDLWGLDSPQAGIDALRAWDLVGAAGAPVGMVDSGADLEHPDLAPNLWRNPGESGQGRETNRVDDDGNGLADDWGGWDWVEDDNDPTDRNGHGTHVAGTIAAQGNDRRGIAGVAWEGAILPLRILNERAVGSVSGLVQAYAYARTESIPIVNASVEDAHYSRSEYAAMAAAPDTLFVVAAGNDGADLDRTPAYPCGYGLENVICVAASGRDGALAEFSNYGARAVDLAAPGAGILSTWVGGGWRLQSGTSMAAPHVAGVGALVSALTGSSGQELKRLLVSSAQPAASLRGKVASGGRLNAYRAVRGKASAGKATSRRLRLHIRLRSRQRLTAALRHGVKLRASCSHACSVRVELSLGARPRGAARGSSHARWVYAGRKGAILGRAGRLGLAVRFRNAAKRKLRRMRRARLAVRASAVSDSNRRGAVVRRVTLVR